MFSPTILLSNLGARDRTLFQRWALTLEEALPHVAEQARIFQRAVFQDPFAGLKTQIEPVECGVALL